MSFSLQDALPYLRCPRTGSPLTLLGEQLRSADGDLYPILDGIPDLTVRSAQQQTRADYDKIAGAGYNLWIFNPWVMAFTWGLGVLKMPALMRPTRELKPGVFLEVPCGTGIFTARAYQKSPRTQIIAVDFSLGMLRAARQRARKLGVRNAVFIRGDVARLPIADGCLDGCLSLAGFHAFPDPRAAAAQLGRVLRPGAKVTVTVACSGERTLSDLMIEHVMLPGGYFKSALPVEAYGALLEQGGFGRMDVKMAGAVAVMRGVRA